MRELQWQLNSLMNEISSLRSNSVTFLLKGLLPPVCLHNVHHDTTFSQAHIVCHGNES